MKYHYADALAQTGQKDDAKRVLREALRPGAPKFDELEAAQKLLRSLGG